MELIKIEQGEYAYGYAVTHIPSNTSLGYISKIQSRFVFETKNGCLLGLKEINELSKILGDLTTNYGRKWRPHD